ncbi:MAG: M48 family metallopeptidase [Steroidobacteraceae bacterium]
MSARIRELQQLPLLDESGSAEDAWRVRPSLRARRLTVRVLPGGLVEIVVPRGTRPKAIERFVTRHRRWIERKVDQYRPLDAAPSGGLPTCIRFAANGQRYDLEHVEAAGAPRLEIASGLVRIHGEGSRPALLRHALQRFTMREAHAVLAPWLARLSTATGLHYARLQIRRQRTRWGSSSRSGTISLNVCLLFQPPAVVNYLLIHELAHTRYMNHSRRFWALVESMEPHWRELDRALSEGWREVPSWVLD